MAVSGLPGLYKMVANRPNGLIVSDLKGEHRKFCSIRRHQFTPLGSVSIYTSEDSTELKKVLESMKDHEAAGNEIPNSNGSGNELTEFFKTILPDYDPSRVYQNDIKKIIKWYSFLKEESLLEAVLADEEE